MQISYSSTDLSSDMHMVYFVPTFPIFQAWSHMYGTGSAKRGLLAFSKFSTLKIYLLRF